MTHSIKNDYAKITTSKNTGFDLTLLAYLSEGLDENAVETLCDNISYLFKNNQLGLVLKTAHERFQSGIVQ